jgi:hypothetical protein
VPDWLIVLAFFVVLGSLPFVFGALARERRNDFLAGVFIGMLVLIVAGLALVYSQRQPLQWEPDDAASSVSEAGSPRIDAQANPPSLQRDRSRQSPAYISGLR